MLPAALNELLPHLVTFTVLCNSLFFVFYLKNSGHAVQNGTAALQGIPKSVFSISSNNHWIKKWIFNRDFSGHRALWKLHVNVSEGIQN